MLHESVPVIASPAAASLLPPGGLEVAQVPLFVQIGFDDNGISGAPGSATGGGMAFATGLARGRRNPGGRGNPATFDGEPVRFSFYVATHYVESAGKDLPVHVKRAWRAAADAGHEIGLHTHSHHRQGATFDQPRWSAELAASREWLVKPFVADRAADPAIGIGLAPAAVVGFRAPFLEHGPPLFAALREQGIAYDCSVEVGLRPGYDGRRLPWPYLVPPSPGGGASAARELWEIPVYVVTVPPDAECERYGVPPGLRERLRRLRHYFDPADGRITGSDWNLWVEYGMTGAEVVATVAYSLDQRLMGNRAPLTLDAHSDIYSEQYQYSDTDQALPNSTAEERRRALGSILDLALSHPEVRAVSAAQLVAWLRDPSPL